MLFPKAHEIEIEIAKIIGGNDKVNSRAWEDPISCFGSDGAPLSQTGFQSTPRMAALTSESGPSPGGRGGGVSGEGSGEGKAGKLMPEKVKADRPRKQWLGGLRFKDQIQCLDPALASQLPQASLVVSGRAASIRNKIKFNSLKRKKKKKHNNQSSIAFLQREGEGAYRRHEQARR